MIQMLLKKLFSNNNFIEKSDNIIYFLKKNGVHKKKIDYILEKICFYYKTGHFKYNNNKFLTLFLSLHNWCNLKCKMCHQNFLPEPDKKNISINDFKKLADNVFPYVKELAYSPTVEPMIHPNFKEILKITSKYNIPNIWMMSNFNNLTKDIAIEIINNNIKHIQISFDSYKPEIYKWIKTNGDVEKVIKNIKLINNLKNKFGKKSPDLEFNFVIMKKSVENFDENYMKLAADLNIKKIHLWHIQINENAKEVLNQSMWNYKKMYNEFYDKIMEYSKKYNIKIFRIPDKFEKTTKTKEKFKCNFPWHKIQAFQNGEFTPCEFWYNEKFWKNLINIPFLDIWNNLQYRKLRWEIANNKLSKECCKKCVSMADLSGRTDDENAFRIIKTTNTDPKPLKGVS